MSKNYFTDSQVENIAVNAGFPVAAKHMKDELRALMNLAAEAAIGGVVATTDFNTGTPANLYSVKELEN